MGIFAGKWPHSLAFQPADVGGPLEQALIGTDVGGAGARSVAIQRRALVRSLDGVRRALSGLSRGDGNFVVA